MSEQPVPNRRECIGLIGLNFLGSDLAERLLDRGYEVLGYDLSPSALQRLRILGGSVAGRSSEVARSCTRLFVSLPDHTVTGDVLRGLTLRSGQIVLDTTTGDPEAAVALAMELQAQGVDYLDATVSGNSVQMREGAVTWMVGGTPQAVQRCEDLFLVLGRRLFHTGASGTGARVKLVVNLVLGLNRAALAEGLAFARALGMELPRTLEILRESAAYSHVMDIKEDKMLSGDIAPQARLHHELKDVRLMQETARRLPIPLPLVEAYLRLLNQAQESDLGELDNSALLLQVLNSALPRNRA